jgi:hypothetical protein
MKLWKKFSILGAVVLLMFTWRPALASVVNALWDFIEIGLPSTPGSGIGRIYFNSTNHVASDVNSSGTTHNMVAPQSCTGGQVVGGISAAGVITCVPGGGGGGGFIQTLTAPVAANFTQVNYNVGSGVTTTQTNNSSPVTSINILQHDPSSTSNMALLVKNKLAATFTITIAFAVAQQNNTMSCHGLVLYDGGNNTIFMGTQTNEGFRVPTFTSLSGAFGGDVAGAIPLVAPGPLLWVRVQETASNRIYQTSSDGINWQIYATESNTAHFTTTQYGIGVEPRSTSATEPDAMLTMYSFSETNP